MTSAGNTTPAVATTPCPSDGEAKRPAPLQSPSSLKEAVERAISDTCSAPHLAWSALVEAATNLVNALPWLIARSEQADRLEGELAAASAALSQFVCDDCGTVGSPCDCDNDPTLGPAWKRRAEAAEAKVSTLEKALRDAREAFLNMIADGTVEENFDGDEVDGRARVYLDYVVRTKGEQFGELVEALGIRAAYEETPLDAVYRVIQADAALSTLPPSQEEGE